MFADIIIVPLLHLIDVCLGVYRFAIICYVVANLCVFFRLLNMNSPLIYSAYATLRQLIEPALRPIRRVVPIIGNIDLSCIALLLILKFISEVNIMIMSRWK